MLIYASTAITLALVFFFGCRFNAIMFKKAVNLPG